MFKLSNWGGVESASTNAPAGRQHRTALAIGLVVAVGATLTGCSTSTGDVAPETPGSGSTIFSQELHDALPESMKAAGKITIAVTPTYPPYQYLDTDGQTVIGQNADVVEKLVEVLGIDIEWVKVNEFGSILSGISGGRYDTAIAFSDSLERQEVVDIVSYYADGSAFNGPASLPHEDTVACGRKVGLGQGSTPDQHKDELNKMICLDAGLPPIEWFPFANSDLAFVAMGSGQVDLTIVSTATGVSLSESSNGEIAVLTKPFLPNPTGMPFAKGNPELTDTIRAGLQVLIDDGTMLDILKKWKTAPNFMEKAGVNLVGSGN